MSPLMNRRSTGAVLLIAALSCCRPAAAAPAALAVSRNGAEITVSAAADVAADKVTAWDVLTSYDRLPDFIPDMSASRTLERHGSHALVLQSGSAGIGPFKQSFSLTLAVDEVRQQSVTARAVAGDFKRFESIYRLRTDDAGHTRIEYSAVIEPSAGIPPLVGVPLMSAAIRRQFEALLAEIDRRARVPPGGRQPVAGRDHDPQAGGSSGSALPAEDDSRAHAATSSGSASLSISARAFPSVALRISSPSASPSA